MTWVVNGWWWTRQTWSSEFQDYYIPLWSTRRVPAFDNWFRKFRTIQTDTLFNKIYDRMNHLILCQYPASKQIIQDANNIELFELLETEAKTQCTVCLSLWNVGVLYRTCGHFLRIFFVPEYVTKKGRLHGHRYGKKQKEFPRSPWPIYTRIRILWSNDWNHRDEDPFCRRWDALADEDHTHHSTAQEYFHYKNEWWLHQKKQGSNTMPLRHRSDFKQALLTLQRMQQEAGEEPRVLAYSYTHEQWEARSSSFTWWNWQGSWWTPHHSESQEGDEPRDEWAERLVACSMWENSSGEDFQTVVYCDRRVVWTQHLKWPVFEMQKCAVIWNTKDFTIKEYSLATSTKVKYNIQKERNLYLVLRLRGGTGHDTNDNVTTRTQNTFNTAHMNTVT